MTSSVPNSTSIPTADVQEAEAIFTAIIHVFAYLSALADIFSIATSLLSILIFNQLRNESPLFTLFLILATKQLLAAILDTLEYAWRFFSPVGLSTGLYGDRFWRHVMYPIVNVLYLFEIWLLVEIVVERWYKHHRREPWDQLRALRWAALIFILCLACSMTQFFERALGDRQFYRVIYAYVVYLIVSFLVPFPLNLAFSIFVAYRYVAAKSSSSINNREDRQELRRTKASLFVTISFALSNSLAYFIFFIDLIGKWSNSDWRLYDLFYELHTMLSSLNVFLGTVYCLIFLPEYRRLFGSYIRKVLGKCGCGRFLSVEQSREEAAADYRNLEDERAAENV